MMQPVWLNILPDVFSKIVNIHNLHMVSPYFLHIYLIDTSQHDERTDKKTTLRDHADKKNIRSEKMKKSTMTKLIVLAVVAMLFSPAVGNAFGGKKCDDDTKGDPSLGSRIPPFMVQQYDTDGDGALSDQEREAAHAAILAKYDTNGDGKLSRGERRAVRDAAHDAFLAKYDTNGDGEISSEERDAIKADFIERFDTNGDGALSKDELPDGPYDFGGRGGHGGPRQ